jgi:hypothetical protein
MMLDVKLEDVSDASQLHIYVRSTAGAWRKVRQPCWWTVMDVVVVDVVSADVVCLNMRDSD